MNIGFGTSATVKVVEIDEKISEGKNQKDDEVSGWLVLFSTH